MSTVTAKWDNVTETLGCGNASTGDPAAVVACMRDPAITTSAILTAITALGPGHLFYPLVRPDPIELTRSFSPP